MDRAVVASACPMVVQNFHSLSLIADTVVPSVSTCPSNRALGTRPTTQAAKRRERLIERRASTLK